MKLEIPAYVDAPTLLNEWALQIKDTQPQKTDELFLLARFFEKADGDLPLAWPLTVELSEKPDFVVAHGQTLVGIEVTQFRAEQLARAEHLASQNKSGMVSTPFDFDSPKRNNQEILKRMPGQQAGLADWTEIGSRVETHTKEMIKVIKKKTHKVVAPATTSCDEIWLLVEDRMYLSNLQVTQMMPRIWKVLNEHDEGPSFDLILFSLMKEVLGFKRNR